MHECTNSRAASAPRRGIGGVSLSREAPFMIRGLLSFSQEGTGKRHGKFDGKSPEGGRDERQRDREGGIFSCAVSSLPPLPLIPLLHPDRRTLFLPSFPRRCLTKRKAERISRNFTSLGGWAERWGGGAGRSREREYSPSVCGTFARTIELRSSARFGSSARG